MRTAIVATAADLATFVALIAVVGPRAEANPLVAAALAGGLAGISAVLGAKLALLVVLASWRAAVGRLARPVWVVGALVGLLGAASNVCAVLA